LTKTLPSITGDAGTLKFTNFSILGKGLQKQGLVLSMNKVLSLADVAVFVTTVESAFTVVSRLGAYSDALFGVTNAASINKNAKEDGLNSLQYLSKTYSSASEFDKSTLVWAWLFMKPNMSFGRGDLFVERNGKVLDVKSSIENLRLARSEVARHGNLEEAITNSQTLSFNVNAIMEKQK
jgi:hypothetical protein